MTLIAFKIFLCSFLAFILAVFFDPEKPGRRTPRWYAHIGGCIVVVMLASAFVSLVLWVFGL